MMSFNSMLRAKPYHSLTGIPSAAAARTRDSTDVAWLSPVRLVRGLIQFSDERNPRRRETGGRHRAPPFVGSFAHKAGRRGMKSSPHGSHGVGQRCHTVAVPMRRDAARPSNAPTAAVVWIRRCNHVGEKGMKSSRGSARRGESHHTCCTYSPSRPERSKGRKRPCASTAASAGGPIGMKL